MASGLKGKGGGRIGSGIIAARDCARVKQKRDVACGRPLLEDILEHLCYFVKMEKSG